MILIPTMSHCHPQWTDKETEAQKGQTPCLRSLSFTGAQQQPLGVTPTIWDALCTWELSSAKLLRPHAHSEAPEPTIQGPAEAYGCWGLLCQLVLAEFILGVGATSNFHVTRGGKWPHTGGSTLGTVSWSTGSGGTEAWVWVSALPLAGSITLGKPQSLKTSVFFYLWNKNIYKEKINIFIRDVYLTRPEHGSLVTLAAALYL